MEKKQLAIDKLSHLLPYLFEFKTMKAILTWPRFSVASYVMVSSLFRLGIRPGTIIDVGANIGQFTIAAANIFKNAQIFAFEPIPSCVRKMRALTAKIPGLRIHSTAVGAKNGITAFHVNHYDQASSLLRLNRDHQSHFPSSREKNTIKIDMCTLDHCFADLSLEKPVLLKVDVQGAEKAVIEGARLTLKQVDHVIMELSFTPIYDGEASLIEVVDMMRKLNYSFVRPLTFLRSPVNGEILQADILFEKPH